MDICAFKQRNNEKTIIESFKANLSTKLIYFLSNLTDAGTTIHLKSYSDFSFNFFDEIFERICEMAFDCLLCLLNILRDERDLHFSSLRL